MGKTPLLCSHAVNRHRRGQPEQSRLSVQLPDIPDESCVSSLLPGGGIVTGPDWQSHSSSHGVTCGASDAQTPNFPLAVPSYPPRPVPDILRGTKKGHAINSTDESGHLSAWHPSARLVACRMLPVPVTSIHCYSCSRILQPFILGMQTPLRGLPASVSVCINLHKSFF